MYTVSLAEDHASYRVNMATFINSLEGFRVLSEASDGAELIKRIEEFGPPDFLILDLQMPGMGGYETAIWLQNNYPGIKILMLSMFDSENVVVRLLNVGVRGFLKKDVHPKEIHEALLHLLKEDTYYFGHQQQARLVQYVKDRVQLDKSLLDDRELEFIKLTCKGKLPKEIAGIMGLSPRTAQYMLDSVLKKLNQDSRINLAVYAANEGLLNL